jgi:hypothetical protein
MVIILNAPKGQEGSEGVSFAERAQAPLWGGEPGFPAIVDIDIFYNFYLITKIKNKK